MRQQMKLGTKLTLGFMTLLAIAMGLGGLAIWNMTAVKKTATTLAVEKVPEVAVAYNLEHNAFNTMFEIRGYALTGDASYLERGKASLSLVKRFLQEAKTLGAASPNLAKLSDAAAKAESAALDYEKLLEQTVTLTDGLEAERTNAETASKKYMEICSAFLVHQNDALLAEITGEDSSAVYERLKKIAIINSLVDMGNRITTGTWKSQFRRDPALFSETKKIFEQVYPKLDELKPLTTEEKNLREIEACREAAKTYEASMEKFLSLWMEREEVSNQRNEAALRVLAEASATVKLGMDETERGAKDSAAALGRTSTLTIYGQIVALAMGLFLAYFLTRGITRPLSRIITGLTDGSQQVSSAAGEVSSAAQSLAEGSSEQAASIEETSSSLEEMSSMTQRNAANAQQANALMEAAGDVVREANGSMKALIRSMGEISTASEETSKIIKTIDEIAFQTNLLALNAAVEAARAGEAGAGFAVVADEVRSLAMRAAEAAKNTAALIEGTVKKVKDGSDLVHRSNDAFKKVAASAGKVGDLVSEIAAASNEQAKGIGQINVAVTELDKLTQQNAANAEESASAAEQMNAQAETMMGIVSELVAMVGGNVAGNQGQTSAVRGQGTARRWGHKGTGPKETGKDQTLLPEAVIPLDDKELDDL